MEPPNPPTPQPPTPNPQNERNEVRPPPERSTAPPEQNIYIYCTGVLWFTGVLLVL